MAGLVPAIHVFKVHHRKAWPRNTERGTTLESKPTEMLSGSRIVGAEMSAELEKKLANRISGWLQQYGKLDAIFCEAVMALPIAECFNESAQKTFKLEPEYHWGVRQKCNLLTGVYFDLAGCVGSDVSFVMETKYLKKKCEAVRSGILIDIVRLSLPVYTGMQRYFVIAGHNHFFPGDGSESAFRNAVFREAGNHMRIDLGKKFDEFRKQNKSSKFASSARWESSLKVPVIDMVLKAEGVRQSSDGFYKTMVWSVEIEPA